MKNVSDESAGAIGSAAGCKDKAEPAVQPTNSTITVAGVTFDASQVKSAIVEIDGREIAIRERSRDDRIGFRR